MLDEENTTPSKIKQPDIQAALNDLRKAIENPANYLHENENKTLQNSKEKPQGFSR